jgi:3-dehydroquinate synthase
MGETIQACARNSTVFIVVDDKIPQSYSATLYSVLSGLGVSFKTIEITASERTKTLATYERICAWLQENAAERTSPLIAFRGGVIGDITGFVASTYQRGIPFIQIPTTLLSMVDSSVGGKVGVNLHGEKNMLGSFYQPVAVFADVTALNSLDKRQLSCGLAECLKHGIIGDEPLFQWTADHIDDLMGLDEASLIELVQRNVSFKARIVEADPKETGDRALLNLGHTFGHALECCDIEKRLFHGEAVSIGVIAACRLSEVLTLAPPDLLPLVESACIKAGLPIRLNFALSADAILQQMKRDKKSTYKNLKLIIPAAIGKTIMRSDIPDDKVRAAIDYVMA